MEHCRFALEVDKTKIMQFSELGEMGLFTEQSVARRLLILLHPQYIYHLDQCVCTYHSDLFVEIPKFSLSQENQIVIQFVLTTDRRETALPFALQH